MLQLHGMNYNRDKTAENFIKTISVPTHTNKNLHKIPLHREARRDNQHYAWFLSSNCQKEVIVELFGEKNFSYQIVGHGSAN